MSNLNLGDKATQIRKDILNASYEAGACHLGSALSCVDMLVELFYKDIEKDARFLFSKASGVATYYAILADKGFFKRKKLAHYLKNHPLPSKEVPGVLHTFGSLGHGLSVAVGLALSDRRRKVYVLISDGELEEGSTWEALISATRLNLDNLVVMVDYNKIGASKEIIMPFQAMFYALVSYNETKPRIKVYDTIKGKGVDFMENQICWHYRNLNEVSLKKALAQL